MFTLDTWVGISRLGSRRSSILMRICPRSRFFFPAAANSTESEIFAYKRVWDWGFSVYDAKWRRTVRPRHNGFEGIRYSGSLLPNPAIRESRRKVGQGIKGKSAIVRLFINLGSFFTAGFFCIGMNPCLFGENFERLTGLGKGIRSTLGRETILSYLPAKAV